MHEREQIQSRTGMGGVVAGIMSRFRGIVSLVVLSTVVLSLPVAADARPLISSFYVKDEGAVIQMKVNFCDPEHRYGDQYSATFRMWDENGRYSRRVVNRRMTGRMWSGRKCGYAWLKVDDRFPNGLYSANVGVANRTTGSFTRIGVRYFRIR